VVDSQGTRLLADIGRSAPGAEVGAMAQVADRLFFLACAGNDRGLWVSGGSSETTLPVPGTEPACSGSSFSGRHLATAAGRVFFLGPDASFFSQLWSTGGGAPVQLTHFTSSSDFAGLDSAVELNGRLLLPLRTGNQSSLWTSDGTLQRTVRLVVLPDVSTIEGLHAVGNEVYFRGFGAEGANLWRTDGTPGGTRKLAADLYLESDFVRAGSSLLFVAKSRHDVFGFLEDGLWRTDGTARGTFPVKVPLGGFYQAPQELTAFQGNVYFFSSDGDRWALWRSDGTTAGTVLVRQFADREESQPIRFGLTVFAGRLFFAASDGGDGRQDRELWTSDGTAEGTQRVADIFPGPGSSLPSGLTVAGGKLYFSANDGTHGAELWESDGTAAGTRLAQDIAPEGASSPNGFTAAGNYLYFTADDGLTGREMWSLPLDGSGCLPSSTRLCLNGGRYMVEASWLAPQIPQKTHGTGTTVPLAGDTGAFWFFDPDNVEAVVKVLDGENQNGHVWVFYGALSDVEYTITVTDTRTGLTRRYFNPLGQLASVGDTHGFGPLGASSIDREPPVSIAAPSLLPLVSERTGKAATAPCQISAQRLCLNNDRFAVEVARKDFQNHEGKGTTVPLTGDTGAFWFFDAANVELVVKVLDGRPFNDHFWIFYGALSNVEYTLTVTDTQTGTVRTYTNPSGRFASVADTSAF
jgi:ELWxxDGT repeat protein